MRLLHYESGNVTLVDFPGPGIPPYGILSHTWGPGDDEVSFQDIVQGTGVHKPGYNKIRFCGSKATSDLQYFWIDTCCIDRSNNIELQEAINSTFRWYHGAVVCYVYLSDVTKTGSTVEPATWTDVKWMKRGWTLVELLAPKSLEFYTADGKYLANRVSHAPRIQKATGIDGRALHGRQLSTFSISERLRWAEGRQTRLDEDAAYCLLGLVDVQMNIAYGEGRTQALMRLQQRIDESQHAKAHLRPAVKSMRSLMRSDRSPQRTTGIALMPELSRMNRNADIAYSPWLNSSIHYHPLPMHAGHGTRESYDSGMGDRDSSADNLAVLAAGLTFTGDFLDAVGELAQSS